MSSSSLKFKRATFPFILVHNYSAEIFLLSFICFGDDKFCDWLIFCPYCNFLC